MRPLLQSKYPSLLINAPRPTSATRCQLRARHMVASRPWEGRQPPGRDLSRPQVRWDSGFYAQKRLSSQASRIMKEELTQREKEKQWRTPWHREGSDRPPVLRPRSAGAMTKGKLLTTPSRLLKLIIPLSTVDKNTDRKDIEPLVLLVHPQQPLSYLERLIQSELPTIKDGQGREAIPRVHFRAEDHLEDAVEPRAKHEKKDFTEEDMHDDVKAAEESSTHSPPEELSQTDDGKPKNLVRWSTSTEVGDFIRDAARSNEFAVEIEGYPSEIPIGVPSFNDRTHYLRSRLRKTAGKIMDLAALKKECDLAAHKGAQRVAVGGAGLLVGYWYLVYRLTFETDLGWDTMEPVTYLVGLSTLICGYLWFLYHNREVSYRSALNLTISRRQAQLYARKGFDNARWEALIEEANGYRREIKQIAREYDVEWDETADEKGDDVTEAMKAVRDEQKGKAKKKGDDDDDEDDDGGAGRKTGKGK